MNRPRSRGGRHAAPTVPPQALPVVLLAATGGGLTLLALPASRDSQSVEAAALTSTSGSTATTGEPSFNGLDVSYLRSLRTNPPTSAAAVLSTRKAMAAPRGVPDERQPPRAARSRQAAAREEQTEAGAPQGRAGILPSSGRLTSGYGPRWGRLHAGLDFGAPSGSPVRAAADGVVLDLKSTARSGGYGNLTILKHPDGTLTHYAHQTKWLVRKGERVEAGQLIGLVGSTGNSTGPHLHFEVHPAGGAAVNPRPWLRARGVQV